MPAPMHLRRLAALFAIVGLVAACTPEKGSGPAGPVAGPPAKAGFKTVSAEGVSLLVPSGWVQNPTPSDQYQKLRYGTTETSGGVPNQAATVYLRAAEFKDLESTAAAQAASMLSVVPGSRQTGRHAITVPGAGRALVTTMTFPTEGGGTGTLSDLVAFVPDGQRLLVRVTNQAGDSGSVDTILGSIRVRG
jgi:hypothetical protein